MQKCSQDLSAGCRKPCPLPYLYLISRRKTPKVSAVIPMRQTRESSPGSIPQAGEAGCSPWALPPNWRNGRPWGWGGRYCTGLGERQCSQSVASSDPSKVVLSVSVVQGYIRITLGSGIFTMVCLWIIASCSSCEKH